MQDCHFASFSARCLQLVTLHDHDLHENPVVRAIPLDISRDGSIDIVAHTGDKLVWYEHTEDAELQSAAANSEGIQCRISLWQLFLSGSK